ncbi:MAG: hypothetical protein NZ908_01125 [Candidatus Micrarchaeota archaeon]|nr:hypothetical protein [Candidatus Micrarchaeota archaeon]
MYEILEYLILLLVVAIIIQIRFVDISVNLDAIEFRYYYSACMERVFDEVYMEQADRLMRIYMRSDISVLEFDESC